MILNNKIKNFYLKNFSQNFSETASKSIKARNKAIFHELLIEACLMNHDSTKKSLQME